MSVKSLPMWGCAANDSQLCVSNLVVGKQCRVSFNLRVGSFGNLKLECLGWSGEGAKTDVGDDEALAKQDLDSLSRIHEKKIGDASKVFDKDFKFLPKPLSATPKDGSKVRVAYQGVPGAYSETAALTAFPDCETVPCNKFESVFKAVELWLVDKAILPIENSLGGSLHRNYDLLLRHRLHIVGEVQLLVDHCLLGLPGVRKEDLKRVLSHPQALEQCEMTLNKLGVVKIKASDTAGAAQIVAARRMRDTAAIASSRAAEIYGLDIIAAGMQDKSENITRYLILSREPIIPGTRRPHKTSIVFSLEKGPGMLFQALAVFSLRDINLSKIESRPQRKRPLRVVEANNKGCAKYFDYLFYIDFEASMAEPRAQFALQQLQELATFIRVLGCYPVNTIL